VAHFDLRCDADAGILCCASAQYRLAFFGIRIVLVAMGIVNRDRAYSKKDALLAGKWLMWMDPGRLGGSRPCDAAKLSTQLILRIAFGLKLI
jgi:hypothetical protein